MNVELMKTIFKFNEVKDDKQVEISVPIEKARNYFEVKAILADNLDDAFNSLRGLAVTKDVPYLRLKSNNDKGSSGVVSFKDFMGLTKPFRDQLTKLELVDESNTRVSILEKAKIDADQGLITYTGAKL